MRRTQIGLMLVLLLTSLTVCAQTRTFTKDDLEYIVELPSPAWRAVSRLDVHDHVDFIYGDDSAKGYLRLRKKLVDADSTPADLFRHDEKWELQSLPGYVVCSECTGEKLEGYLKGTAFSYEYTSGGRPMAGSIYYLWVDNRTFYALNFTVARDKLSRLHSEMDSIARSFRLK
jgi:hypothetical protein